MIISGTVKKNVITETNIIYSERNIDLNGDGDFNDSYKFLQKGKKLYINNRQFVPVQSQNSYKNYIIRRYIDEKGSQTINSVDEKGLPIFVDSISASPLKITFMIGRNTQKPPVIKIDNPSLILIALKPVMNTTAKPSFSFRGMKNRSYLTNDYNIPGSMDMYAKAVWINIPLKVSNAPIITEHFLEGIKPPFQIKAFIDFSFQTGITLRSPEKVLFIKTE